MKSAQKDRDWRSKVAILAKAYLTCGRVAMPSHMLTSQSLLAKICSFLSFNISVTEFSVSLLESEILAFWFFGR